MANSSVAYRGEVTNARDASKVLVRSMHICNSLNMLHTTCFSTGWAAIPNQLGASTAECPGLMEQHATLTYAQSRETKQYDVVSR